MGWVLYGRGRWDGGDIDRAVHARVRDAEDEAGRKEEASAAARWRRQLPEVGHAAACDCRASLCSRRQTATRDHSFVMEGVSPEGRVSLVCCRSERRWSLEAEAIQLHRQDLPRQRFQAPLKHFTACKVPCIVDGDGHDSTRRCIHRTGAPAYPAPTSALGIVVSLSCLERPALSLR